MSPYLLLVVKNVLHSDLYGATSRICYSRGVQNSVQAQEVFIRFEAVSSDDVEQETCQREECTMVVEGNDSEIGDV
ncbi:uncharacterized protein LOC122092665 isoform X2 [Macadamia integrifolia]|nr:uncharacterized protein LOC122092665 isoform X2 [Macadamia integrifolia]